MTKKSIVALLSTTVLLTQGVVFADELAPVDSTTPASEVVPPSTEPSEPIVPVDPTTPSTGNQTDDSTTVPGTSEEDPSIPATDPTEPSEPETPVETEEPSTEPTEQSGEVEVPTTDGGTSTVTPDTSVPTNNPNISADAAHNAGASQVGTTSTVTGQVVRDVTTTNPVQLANGATITDIRDGLVTLSTGAKVAPESVGVTQNSDGTYTAKTIQGDMVTLPHTGEKNTAGLSAIGFFSMSLLGVGSWRKHQKHKI